MKKPKLYWLHSHFLYWMGGTKYIFEVLKRLAPQYDLTVIVEDALPSATELYTKQGIKLINLHKLSTNNIIYWLTFPWQLLMTVLKVKKLLPRQSIVVSSMFPMNVVAALTHSPAHQLIFEPFAFFHDPDFQKGFPLLKRILLRLLKFLYGPLDIWATRKSAQILTLNTVTQKGIRQIYRRDSTPVYTGIDSTHFHPHVSAVLKKKYQGKHILIHSTDYTPVKGTNRMIRLFARVKQLDPLAHLLITTTIRNSTQEAAYRQLSTDLAVADSIEFLGFVDYDLLPELYSLAKILVQCSYSELSGTTSMALPVKEALACGTAAIRSPVTKEDVEEGVTGYLVDPRNEDLMVKRIMQLLKLTPAQLSKLARIARAKIVKLYTWEQTATKISRIINAI